MLYPRAGYHVKSTPICQSRMSDSGTLCCSTSTHMPALPRPQVMLTSIGNFPSIQTSCAAYAVNFLMPLTCGSRELIASARSLSIASISATNISGCWSYLVEMYWRIADDSETEWVFRKGKYKMLLYNAVSRLLSPRSIDLRSHVHVHGKICECLFSFLFQASRLFAASVGWKV